MSLGTIAIVGFSAFGAYSLFSSKSNSSTTKNLGVGTGGSFGNAPTSDFNNNGFLKGIIDNFNKPNVYKKPNQTKKGSNSGYNSQITPNNSLITKLVTPNLAITRNSQGQIVGGMSSIRMQSLTPQGAKLELANINNPLVKILRKSSSGGSHRNTTSKKSNNQVKSVIYKSNSKKPISKILNIRSKTSSPISNAPSSSTTKKSNNRVYGPVRPKKTTPKSSNPLKNLNSGFKFMSFGGL